MSGALDPSPEPEKNDLTEWEVRFEETLTMGIEGNKFAIMVEGPEEDTPVAVVVSEDIEAVAAFLRRVLNNLDMTAEEMR